MRNENVIINASPLIALFRIGLERILGELWKEVLVPEAVWQEVAQAGKNDSAAIGLPQAKWANRRPVASIHPLVTAWALGAGGSSVISLATEQSAARVVLDDAQARKCAQTLGLRLSGTGGILVFAKREGLIDSVSEVFEQLSVAGFRLSPEIAAKLIHLAGE